MATIQEIATSLEDTAGRLKAQFRSNGWSTSLTALQAAGGYAPPVSADFIESYVKAIAVRILNLTKDELDSGDFNFLNTVKEQTEEISFNSLANDPDAVIGGFMQFLQAISGRLPPRVQKPEIDWEDLKGSTLLPKDLARRLRGVEARVKDFVERAGDLEKKIADIEAAHSAAEQLPTDLEELARQRETMHVTIGEAEAHALQIKADGETAVASLTRIAEAEQAAAAMINRSEQALRGATGVGLAAAFEKRASILSWTGFGWTAGLAVALIAAFAIGAERVTALKDILIGNYSATVIWVNALLAVLGIGAPVWFAWLSTKQIWASFRLAEDYAFKASVSKAYEGYRAEAVSIDDTMQARLFAAALTRLEEAPIRLFDAENHGTPLQELMSNKAFRRALESVPGAAEKLLAIIPSKGPLPVIGSAAVLGAAATHSAGETDLQEEADAGRDR